MEHKQELGHKDPTLHEIHHMEMDPPSIAITTDASKSSTTAEDEQEVSFFHDFIAGGIAGSASIVVGHPMDTLKVRMQTAKGNPSISSLVVGAKYGGPVSLFRGVTAPLSAACAVNAIIFSSYGWSSRLYEQYSPRNDPNIKAFTCGSFAGLVQAMIICPIEHVKCRMQIEESAGAAATSMRTTLRTILTSGGSSANISALYRGWWITCWREIPAFGAYFSLYDIFKDRIQYTLEERDKKSMTMMPTATGEQQQEQPKAHTWFASAIAGGLTGALTWAIVYPFDVIKTQIQTAPVNTPQHERTIAAITSKMVKENGWKHLFRGLSVTCLRAFPVNGIIFPVYEYTLLLVCAWES